MLNVREATTKKMTENNEVSQLVKILGLNYGEKYTNKSDLSKLRYGKLMIMADQDQDGSHIKGLVINFIHYKWPNLLKHDYIEVFITPILKVRHSFLPKRILGSVAWPQISYRGCPATEKMLESQEQISIAVLPSRLFLA